MKQWIELLGYEVKDKVTGFAGVCTSVSFDLYGCVQVIVTPKVTDDNKKEDGRWFDFHRLEVTSAERVMPVPAFVFPVPAQQPEAAVKGPEPKPIK